MFPKEGKSFEQKYKYKTKCDKLQITGTEIGRNCFSTSGRNTQVKPTNCKEELKFKCEEVKKTGMFMIILLFFLIEILKVE